MLFHSRGACAAVILLKVDQLTNPTFIHHGTIPFCVRVSDGFSLLGDFYIIQSSAGDKIKLESC